MPKCRAKRAKVSLRQELPDMLAVVVVFSAAAAAAAAVKLLVHEIAAELWSTLPATRAGLLSRFLFVYATAYCSCYCCCFGYKIK